MSNCKFWEIITPQVHSIVIRELPKNSPPPPILRDLDNFPLGAFYSTNPLLHSLPPAISHKGVHRTRSLCIEIYKNIKNLNPEFTKNLFKVCKTKRSQREQYKLNLEIQKSNQVSFGTKSLRIQGSTVWNALPFHIKSKKNLQAFEYVIRLWDRSKCSCNICFNSKI